MTLAESGARKTKMAQDILSLVGKRRALLSALQNDGSATRRELVERTEQSRSTVYRALKTLSEKGLVERVGSGDYHLTYVGRTALESYCRAEDEVSALTEEEELLNSLASDADIPARLVSTAETIRRTHPTPNQPRAFLREWLEQSGEATLLLPVLIDQNLLSGTSVPDRVVTTAEVEAAATLPSTVDVVVAQALPEYLLFADDEAVAVGVLDSGVLKGVLHTTDREAVLWGTNKLQSLC